LPIERYLYALLPSGHTVLDYTEGIEAFSDQQREYLRTRPIGEHDYWLPHEQYIVHQRVEPVEDDAGRIGVWNTAALIPIQEYLQRTHPQILLSPHLLSPCESPPILHSIPTVDDPPTYLEPITIEET
jgi:hypothetical protein